MADDLQRIQFRMAQGDKSAYPAQLKQLKAMGAAIASAKPETWQDRREADALVIYVLSGGALADVMALLKSDAVPESDRTLARGALAYITSHEADALDLLSAVDIKTLEPRVAGQVAFARSVLETKRDPKAAASFLDWARLVAPGGLVEEAALRREIALIAEGRDAPRAAMLTRQYASRFGASLYAADFFRELARLIARFGLADDPANYQLLSGAAASLPPDGRRDFLLTLAKAAIVNARFDAASAAAAEALKSASPDSVDEARARLYLDAGRLISDGYDAARADLQAIAACETRPLRRRTAGLGSKRRGSTADGAERGSGRSAGRSARRGRQGERPGADDRTGRGGAQAHRTRGRRNRREVAMTAIAPAPAHAPPPAHSAHPAHAPPPAQDHLAFSAVLDSVPAGEAKARPSPGERGQRPADPAPRDRPQAPLMPNPSFFSAALASSLPVATTATAASGAPQAEPGAPALAASAAARTPDPAAISASRAATQPAADTTGARLAGERTFHASGPAFSAAAASAPPGPSTPARESPSPTNAIPAALDAAAPSPATPAAAAGGAAPSPPEKPPTPAKSNAARADWTPTVPSGQPPVSAGPTEGRAAERRRGSRRPSRRARREAGFEAGREPRRRGTGSRFRRVRRPPVQRRARRVSVFASAPPLAAAAPLQTAFADPNPRGAGAAAGAGAPRAAPTAAASPAPSAAPVREIDVDLSPGGLENVSMTMRLAGDRLSLVIRAASSQTTGAIEGARDAIAERMAAIGQPLGSLIIQQTGSADGANARGSSSGEGEGGRPQGRGGDPGDPRGARRGSSGF